MSTYTDIMEHKSALIGVRTALKLVQSADNQADAIERIESFLEYAETQEQLMEDSMPESFWQHHNDAKDGQ